VHFARGLIDETDLPITEIVHASGFASVRQFNHALKATFHEPPTALRRARHRPPPMPGAAGTIAVKLPFRHPLAWDAMLQFLRTRAITGVEDVRDGVYRRTIDIGGAAGVLEVALSEPAGRKSPQVASRPHHTSHLVMRVGLAHGRSLIDIGDRVRRIFDLDADSALIGEQLSESPLLRSLVERLPGLRVPGAWDGLELAVRAILGQQVSVEAATTLAGRIARTFGTPLSGPDRTGAAGPQDALTHVFPHAEALAAAPLESVGLPRSRADAIRAVARAVATGELRFDAPLGLDEAVERLCALPGIGPWTASYIAMRALAEPDAFPETDLGVRHALGSRANPASLEEVRRQSAPWRPWRSYATIYLWHDLVSARQRGADAAVKTPPPRKVRETRARAAAAPRGSENRSRRVAALGAAGQENS